MFQIRKTGMPVQPTSKANIRNIANLFRSHIERNFGQYGTFCPITKALEILGQKPFEDFSFEILDDNDPSMVDKWAYTTPDNKCIYIKNSVYNNACQHHPQSRFTIAHELGHLLLGHKLDIVFARQNGNTKIPCFRDSEWQADTFAAELLMPAELAKGLCAEEIERQFGVSASAAVARGDRLRKEA